MDTGFRQSSSHLAVPGIFALSKRAGTPFRARQRGVSLSKRAEPQPTLFESCSAWTTSRQTPAARLGFVAFSRRLN